MYQEFYGQARIHQAIIVRSDGSAVAQYPSGDGIAVAVDLGHSGVQAQCCLDVAVLWSSGAAVLLCCATATSEMHTSKQDTLLLAQQPCCPGTHRCPAHTWLQRSCTLPVTCQYRHGILPAVCPLRQAQVRSFPTVSAPGWKLALALACATSGCMLAPSAELALWRVQRARWGGVYMRPTGPPA